MNRRDFLKLAATTTAALAAASCSINYKDNSKVLPYLVPPDPEIIPGMPIFYKSTCTECNANCGTIVKAYDKVINNRHTICPIKLEGVKENPVNLGGLCIRGQASLTRLYHPDRIQSPLIKDGSGKFQKTTWEEAFKRVSAELQKAKSQGKKNVYLSGRTTGSLSDLIDETCEKLAIERAPEFEPLSYSAIRNANKILFNKNEIPFYDIEHSDFLLTIGADVVGTFVSPVSYGKQYSDAIKRSDFAWTHVEPHLTLSGLSAYNRIIIKPGSEAYLLVYLLKKTAKGKMDAVLSALPNLQESEVSAKTGIPQNQLEQMATQLAKASKPLLIVGEISTSSSDSEDIAILAGLLQWSTGMIGSTIDFSKAENYAKVGNFQDLQNLANRLKANGIGVIFISHTDPVSYSTDFEQNLKNASFRVGMSELLNDSLKECDIIFPLSHTLESWGDAQPRKNIVSVIQPSLTPIFDTKSEGDILLELSGQPATQNYQLYLFAKWKKNYGDTFNDNFLKTGFHEIPLSHESVTLNANAATYLKSLKLEEPPKGNVLAIVPSLRFYDGRGKALPLLSEVPDPLTTISYGEWVSVPEDTATSLGLKDGDVVSLSAGKDSFKYPIKIQPDLPSGIYVIQYGNFDGKNLLSDKNGLEKIAILENIQIQKTGDWIQLPILSGSMHEEGRGIIPEPIDKQKHEEYEKKAGLYNEPNYPDYRWGMAIDLDSCTGCSACVAACHIENNVPVVGANDHIHGRTMSWIRIEPFFERESQEFVPMLCQQCDYAPCESVCPVFASYHTPEGLNAQLYNRCIGTRFCSNNCPYKVRRFNWFDHEWKSPLDRMLNPEMFVRGRGVMEKCTFCVQRIRSAKDHASDEKRHVKDGEVVPACAQTCPTNAITFGNLKDKNSLVYLAANSKKANQVFDYLGVGPAVYYLSKKNEVKV